MGEASLVRGLTRRLLVAGGPTAALVCMVGRGVAQVRSDATGPASDITQDWHPAAKAVAEEMLRRYGAPQETTATMLIWRGNGPWKRTLVHKTPVEHDFPTRHMDVLEQVVEYRVPLNFFEPLARFNGSILPDRTRGDLTAWCDREATNILVLNLAHDIIRGGKTVEQAREAMAAGMHEIGAGSIPADARELRLGSPQGDLRDPDSPMVAPGSSQGTPQGPLIVR
ncbi:hypothetical protein JMJ55_26905 [Belnapia sp. T6]|uniref:Uncharacterized protein n=1 Tax=Belnapia mucosa TaxID=2804532 RepID=A0ABS1VBA5_9PROT|nr:hypothetical protein [Belnapia mucosa]MBL6458964.1 hypothetical protein [Belnapia mucosa]